MGFAARLPAVALLSFPPFSGLAMRHCDSQALSSPGSSADPPVRGTGPRGLQARVLDLLLTREPHQRIRLGMCLLAALLMLCGIAAMYLSASAGLASLQAVHWWTLTACAIFALAYTLIRSGYSRRWRDPALTLFQCLAAMTCVAAAYVIALPARGLVLPLVAVILMFGVFGLAPRQMMAVLVYSLVLFSLTIAGVQWRQPEDGPPWPLAGAYLIVTAVVLLSSTFLILRAHAIRTKLHRQKVQLALAVEQVREMATRDELTGLPNRHCMLEMLHAQREQARRDARPVLVAQLDLDHFKVINDTCGHAGGDAVLQGFAHQVSRCLRAGDTLARWGGEEFVLLMVGVVPHDGAGMLARVLAAAATPVRLPDGNSVRLTVSIGVARLRPHESVDAVLQRADAALYAAKHQGRNRIAWAPGDAPEWIA